MTEYFNNIGNIALLSHEEEIELVKKIEIGGSTEIAIDCGVIGLD